MRRVLLLICCCICALSVQARSSDSLPFAPGELTPVESDFFADIDGGAPNAYTLYDGFLIASGITERGAFEQYQQKLGAIRTRALAELDRTHDAYTLGKELLLWLHANYFLKYKTHASTVDGIIDHQEFNCLSSGILYLLLARDLGLDVTGVMVPDHAFCLLHDKRGDVDVETTARYGFNPGQKEIDKLGHEMNIIHLPKTSYTIRYSVSGQQMIARVYTNEAYEQEQKAEAGVEIKELLLHRKAYYFDPEWERNNKDIDAVFYCAAAYEVKQQQFAKALSLLWQWHTFDPTDTKFPKCTEAVYQDYAAEMVGKQDYTGAISLLKSGQLLLPNSQRLRAMIFMCYNQRAKDSFEKHDYETALTLLQDCPDARTDPTLNANLHLCYQNVTFSALQRKDYPAAITYLKRWKAFDANDPEFTNMTDAVYSQKAHIKIYEKKDREAIAELKAGLALAPKSTGLKSYMALIYTGWGNQYFAKHDYLNAARVLELGLRACPTPIIRGNLQSCYICHFSQLYQAKQYKEARQWCARALKIFPKDAELLKLQRKAGGK